MKISDPLYGEYFVETVLEELIQSKSVQRLKGIHQGGASYLVNEKWNGTRYEHSVGVMLLIRKLGGSIEEQIAGLLHDVSHTAFSHVIDFVFANQEEDYHEKIYERVIKESNIPSILRKYGFNPLVILSDESKWTILEQPAPELCADRVDYTLRDMFQFGTISLRDAHAFLDDLMIQNGKMCMSNIESAEWFVETYYKEVIDYFMDPLNVYGNDQLAKILRSALEENILTTDDLLGTDEGIMNRLCSTDNEKIQHYLNSLHQNVKLIEDKENFDVQRKGKVRLIDPTVLHDNKFVPASTVSEKIQRSNEEAYRKSIQGMQVKVISV